MTIYYPTEANFIQKTLNAQLVTGVTASATLNNITSIQNKAGIMIIDRVDANGVETPSKVEVISFAGTSGSTVTTLVRGLGSTTDQDHEVGAIVEFGPDIVWAQGLIDTLLAEHNTDGTHKTDALSSMVDGTEAQGDLVYYDGSKWVRLAKGSGTQQLRMNSGATAPEWFTATAAASFWTSFTGAYASGTTITVSGVDMTTIFKKGVILKWLKSDNTFKTGMVISSAFSTNTTITIIGSTVESGDKTFYYGADALVERFIVPGTLAAATDIAKTWYCATASYPLGCDAHVKTAGTTNATEFDINDDGTTIFNGTAASIASGATSDLANTAYTPTTVIAADSAITVDINSVSTTAPVEAYIDLFYYPQWWASRT